jgi:hypothetical protein
MAVSDRLGGERTASDRSELRALVDHDRTALDKTEYPDRDEDDQQEPENGAITL